MSSATELVVLSERGKPGRDVLELLGDGKTENFGRPIMDQDNSPGVITHLVEGPSANAKGRYVEFTGDNCGPNTCFALVFYKSYHGILDISQYQRLTFDVAIDELPENGVSIRIGSFPSRAEVNITNRLPGVDRGWKTISIGIDEFRTNSFENFDLKFTEDVFSIGSDKSGKLRIANIRWQS